ncbi:IS3 family transposase [Thermodesulfobacteriota bacterium]
MDEHRTQWSVGEMCRVFSVSRSGYYSWRSRPESQRSVENRRLDIHIKAIYTKHKGRSGSPKITEELHDNGFSVSKNRVARRMKAAGLRSIVRRKFRPTTDSKHSHPIAANLLQRDFSASAPNTVWVSDITYIATERGWLYLTVFIDLFSRMVTGWALSSSLSADMVLTALYRGIRNRRPGAGLIIHSDRGVQYACKDFRKVLEKHRFVQSMSRKGDCWDNAVAESFFSIIKSELIHHERFRGPKDTLAAVFEYIEIYYNRNRKHSTLGYQTPDQFERSMKSVVCF